LPAVGKASRNKKSSDSVKVTKVQNPDQGRSWFLPVMVVVTLLGAVAVGLLAMNRESNADVRPLLSDHWHAAYGIYVCDSFQDPIQDISDPEGVHTHADGIIHIHPFRTTASGNNATVDAFFRATASVLDDDGLTPGPGVGGAPIVEADGCNGEPATWQIAYWDNAILAEGGAAPDTVLTTDLADFRFRGDVAAITFALVPEGAEIPPPPSIPGLSNLTDI
jgi:hypothetical protein